MGATRNAGTVAEFELLYHEIGSIIDCLDQVTTNNLMKHTECHLQRAMSSSRRTVFNENVQKLLDFVQATEKPYLKIVLNVTPLHHLLSHIAVNKIVSERLIKCLGNGEKI